MIYITTQATVESETGSMKNPRIGYQTWTRDRSASNIVVSTEAASGPRDAPLRESTYDYWLPTAAPATWRVDFGSAKLFNYVGIAAHTLGSAGASVQVYHSSDDITYSASSNSFSPTDDSPILLVFPGQTKRYMRLNISQIARVGVVYVGGILAMPYTIYGGHAPITLNRDTVLSQVLSKGGAFLGQSYRKHGLKGAVALKNLDATWYRNNFDPFVKEARKYPFFWAWRGDDADGTLATLIQKEVAYAWATSDIHPSNMGKKNWMSVSFNLTAIGYE